jgi:heat shock protein HslJ
VLGGSRRGAHRREPHARAPGVEEVTRAPAAHRLIALAAAILFLGAVACSTAPTNSSPAQPVGLEGFDWVLDDSTLASLVAKVPAGVPIDLRFEGDQASGSSGCNTYGAGFHAIGGSISFDPFRSTAMACEGPVMALESAYLRALEGSTAYQVIEPQAPQASYPPGACLYHTACLYLTGGAADLTFTRPG